MARELSVEKRIAVFEEVVGKMGKAKIKVESAVAALTKGVAEKKFNETQLPAAKTALKRGAAIIKTLDKITTL